MFAVVGKHTFMNNNKSKYKNGIRNKTNTNIKVRHKTKQTKYESVARDARSVTEG